MNPAEMQVDDGQFGESAMPEDVTGLWWLYPVAAGRYSI